MSKKNGFSMYMTERKVDFPNTNTADLPELISNDWKQLTLEQKQVYTNRAKIYNDLMKLEKSSTQPKANPPIVLNSLYVPCKMTPYDIGIEYNKHELAKSMRDNQSIVYDMFKRDDWKSLPVVVCSFTLYFDPFVQQLFAPAEIGLSTFSLKDGVTDNFGRIIDPGQPPLEFVRETTERVNTIGVPFPGSVPELSDFQSLLNTLEAFVDKYSQWHTKSEMYVFALDTDYEIVHRCLNWMYDFGGFQLPITILSLNLYGYLASTNSDTLSEKVIIKENNDAASQRLQPCYLLFEKPAPHNSDLFTGTVASNRVYGVPLNSCVEYSRAHPQTKFGLFTDEYEVEAVVKHVDNYKYYEEICCMYHIKKGNGVEHCALNMSNRYAYNLLEILTLCNEVTLQPGRHFPEVSNYTKSVTDRYKMLKRWGVTKLEENLEDPLPFVNRQTQLYHPCALVDSPSDEMEDMDVD